MVSVSNALQQKLLQVVNAVMTLTLVIGMVLYLNVQLKLLIVGRFSILHLF